MTWLQECSSLPDLLVSYYIPLLLLLFRSILEASCRGLEESKPKLPTWMCEEKGGKLQVELYYPSVILECMAYSLQLKRQKKANMSHKSQV